MTLPFYLAMTGAEAASLGALPEQMAWMACHFSCYGTGLSNLPAYLPEGAAAILNDRTPICGHDPIRIAGQLAQLVTDFGCSGVLLDLQRPGVEETAKLCAHIVNALPCPVGVSEFYANGLDCPVFLSALPPGVALVDHIRLWQGREIWLEMAVDTRVALVTEAGCRWEQGALTAPEEPCFSEPALHCRYHWYSDDEKAVFTLHRTREDIPALLEEAEGLGVTRVFGLYQQFGLPP